MSYCQGAGSRLGLLMGLLGVLVILSAAPRARAQEEGRSSEPIVKPAPVSDTLAIEPGDSVPFEPGVDPDAEPLRIFAAIEWAWTRGSAESLIAHFGNGKVSLSFSKGGPRGGLFTR